MKDEQKKDAARPMKIANTTLEKVFGPLAEVLHEEEAMHMNSPDAEPFDSYVEKVRGKVHKDLNLFRSRLAQGYRVLLEELEQEQSSPENSKRR